jgi:hypothetical protein
VDFEERSATPSRGDAGELTMGMSETEYARVVDALKKSKAHEPDVSARKYFLAHIGFVSRHRAPLPPGTDVHARMRAVAQSQEWQCRGKDLQARVEALPPGRVTEQMASAAADIYDCVLRHHAIDVGTGLDQLEALIP